VTEHGSDGKDRSSHGSLKSPSSSGKHASGASNGSDGVGGITASARATGAPVKPVAAAAVTTAAASKKSEAKREAAETKRVEKQRKQTTVARAVDGIPLAFRAALLLLIFATSILAVVSFRERRRATSVARIALLDHLTGLSNREGFDRQMATEWERAQRHGRPLGMIFVDLDHFKGFNDTHGHVAGDRLLREVAAAITATARGADFTARLGGDEFVVVCPDTDADGLARLTERLRVAAAGMAVSLSIGAASKRDSDNSPDELVHRADLAMYESKGGRRRGASSANPMLGSLRRG
jgi:diguanylate cyclase (GGDEF)-like protein